MWEISLINNCVSVWVEGWGPGGWGGGGGVYNYLHDGGCEKNGISNFIVMINMDCN